MKKAYSRRLLKKRQYGGAYISGKDKPKPDNGKYKKDDDIMISEISHNELTEVNTILIYDTKLNGWHLYDIHDIIEWLKKQPITNSLPINLSNDAFTLDEFLAIINDERVSKKNKKILKKRFKYMEWNSRMLDGLNVRMSRMIAQDQREEFDKFWAFSEKYTWMLIEFCDEIISSCDYSMFKLNFNGVSRSYYDSIPIDLPLDIVRKAESEFRISNVQEHEYYRTMMDIDDQNEIIHAIITGDLPSKYVIFYKNWYKLKNLFSSDPDDAYNNLLFLDSIKDFAQKKNFQLQYNTGWDVNIQIFDDVMKRCNITSVNTYGDFLNGEFKEQDQCKDYFVKLNELFDAYTSEIKTSIYQNIKGPFLELVDFLPICIIPHLMC